MRFFSAKKDTSPRWVDVPELNWVPEPTVRLDPGPRRKRPVQANAARPGKAVRTAEPRREPSAEERREPLFHPDVPILIPVAQESTPMAAAEPEIEPAPVPAVPAVAKSAPAPESIAPTVVSPPVVAPQPPAGPLPQPANSNSLTGLMALRLCIGVTQGLALFALLRMRDLNLLPGAYTFSALCLPLLFVPLLVMEGLDTMRARALIGWAAVATFLLAGLGIYQGWRIDVPVPAHAGYALLLLVCCALFIGQVFVSAASIADRRVAPYHGYVRIGWTLAVRLGLWLLVTGLVWALAGGLGSLLSAWRAPLPAALLALPATGLASAAILELTAPPVLHPLARGLRAALAALLPALVVVATLIVARSALVQQVPLALLLGAGFALLLSFNAAYGSGQITARPHWRRAIEAGAAMLLPILAGMAVAALAARVLHLGWTAPRIFAGVAVLFLAAWGVAYLAAALLAVGGGGWLKAIEPANRMLGLAVMLAALALASPLADPMRLVASAQVARLTHGDIAPDHFDFPSLKRDDARFGYEALTALTRDANPDIARGATLGLIAASEQPSPTEIGANIRVLTPGGRLPTALLTRDWRALNSPAVPPCLTDAALGCDAWFLDLDGDGQNEILLAYGDDSHWWATAMKRGADGQWQPLGTMAAPACRGTLAALREGRFTTAPALSPWRDILAGGARLSLRPAMRRPACS